MTTIINDQMSNTQHEATHHLFSTGYLFDGFDYFDSLDKLSTIAKHSPLQVQERMLCCKTSLIMRSRNLDELVRLETKLVDIGLDVFIESSVLPKKS